MKPLYVDTETYSEVDIKSAGAYKYTENCEMILARFVLGDHEREFVWEIGDEFPRWIHEHIEQNGEVVAFNAIFDYMVLQKHFPKLTIYHMRDVQAQCMALGLPSSLDKACKAVGMEQEKAKSSKGKALIRQFCMPRKETIKKPWTRDTKHTDPENWALFRDEYLYKDVEAIIELHTSLPKMSDQETAYWIDNAFVNYEGIPVDIEMVETIHSMIQESVDHHASEFIRLTGVFPTQLEKFHRWLENNGKPMPNLTASTIKKALEGPLPDQVRKAFKIRQNISHAAFKKYPAFMACTMSDNTVKGGLQYYAAHTGRYGGRLVQPHNFPRGTIDAEEAVDSLKHGEYSVELVKSAVRGMVWHPEGFTIADYSSIEARVLMWLARDEEALQEYRDGKDQYVKMASYIYGIEPDLISAKQRFVGKQAVLGLGYQMGPSKFYSQATGYGAELDDRTAIKAVMVYRRRYDKVVNLWGALVQGATMALERPGKRISVNRYIKFYRPPSQTFLYMILPSGRRIAYPFPEPDEGNLSYMTTELHQWKRVQTYGGKLVENAVQGIARDILAAAVARLVSKVRVAFHVHDEIVVVGDHKDTVKEAMLYEHHWAEELPLEVDIQRTKRFKKL